VHRDLKLENVIFKNKPLFEDDEQDLTIKVIDFGIAGVCDNGKTEKQDAGSLCYMPPETLMGKAVDAAPSIDVWAIGIMFYSLLYGTLPFYGKGEDQTVKLIKTAPVKYPKDIIVTPQTREIITRMLEKEPEKRLDLMDFMETDYYRMDDESFKKMVDTHYE